MRMRVPRLMWFQIPLLRRCHRSMPWFSGAGSVSGLITRCSSAGRGIFLRAGHRIPNCPASIRGLSDTYRTPVTTSRRIMNDWGRPSSRGQQASTPSSCNRNGATKKTPDGEGGLGNGARERAMDLVEWHRWVLPDSFFCSYVPGVGGGRIGGVVDGDRRVAQGLGDDGKGPPAPPTLILSG